MKSSQPNDENKTNQPRHDHHDASKPGHEHTEHAHEHHSGHSTEADDFAKDRLNKTHMEDRHASGHEAGPRSNEGHTSQHSEDEHSS